MGALSATAATRGLAALGLPLSVPIATLMQHLSPLHPPAANGRLFSFAAFSATFSAASSSIFSAILS